MCSIREASLPNPTRGWARDGSPSIASMATPAKERCQIHAGVTEGAAISRPALRLQTDTANSRNDGAISEDDRILATYLHGLFDSPAACEMLLRWAGVKNAQSVDYDARRLASIETLADVVAQHVRLDVLRENAARRSPR